MLVSSAPRAEARGPVDRCRRRRVELVALRPLRRWRDVGIRATLVRSV